MATAAARATEKTQLGETPKELQADALPLEDQIRARAYEIWQLRDGQVGSDVEDWLQAEEEIRCETAEKEKNI